MSPSSSPVLVAPDSFKGTLRAAEVADAVARGLEGAGRAADRCPVADGGEGTGEALGAERVPARARDPLGRPVDAWWGRLSGGRALVETAAASGLALLEPRERDPERATTHGTGDLVAAALAAGAREVLVASGGSATVDGGAGALEAIAAAGGLRGARLTVLCDVATPWEEAAATFGPQKGAGPAEVARLSARLEAMAASLPCDPRGVALTGSAGGLAGGLWAVLGAELVPGAAWVLDSLSFTARLVAAGAVITGEGRLDPTSLHGKAVAEVAARARAAGVPCHAVTGERALAPEDARALGLGRIVEAGDLSALEEAGRALARLI